VVEFVKFSFLSRVNPLFTTLFSYDHSQSLNVI